jgi:glycosyltransferase involved in cell wall biosynthesis
MSTTPSRASSTSPSCVFLSAEPFFWDVFAGIPRYTARLGLALAACVPVRFFVGNEEVLAPASLSWSQDQDLEQWGRTIARSERRPLGSPPQDCIGLYCLARSPRRTFHYELNVVHDFCAMVLPWAFPSDLREGYVKYLTEHVLESDFILADSLATKADATWFSPLDADRIVVAHPGPSLCVGAHGHRDPVERSGHIGLVVSTIEPRKIAGFVFDWFHKTTSLPGDTELWWVGKLGWGLTPADLQRMACPVSGRRVRFLRNVSDAELCRLYQMAGWSIYPSRYEGFGFPILDSLRHGTPVLASRTSSMAEFDHAGVFFFDPDDPRTLDHAWQRLQDTEQPTIPRSRLDELYSWDRVARTILDAYARTSESRKGRLPQSITSNSVKEEPAVPGLARPEPGVPMRPRPQTAMRIGIGPFTARTASHNRGLGRYVRMLISALLARDHHNSYVFYCPDRLIADQVPAAPNAEIHLLRRDEARGEADLTQALTRVITTNPDALNAFLLLDAPALTSGSCVPSIPANGLKVAALIHDLLPLFFTEDSSASPAETRRLRREVEIRDRLSRYDAILATSEANREGLRFIIGGASDRVVTIGLAVDDRFFFPDKSTSIPNLAHALFQKLGIASPFVLSVGSMEYQRRDNLWGLIEAFARLPAGLRDTHQLVLTYDLSSQARKRASQCAADHGVADRLVLTDRLGVKALRFLYRRCAAFVSLTSYEELALPILEAMHCGAPIVIGSSAAQREVAGDAGLVFNVTDARELGHRLSQVLNEPEPARQLCDRAAAHIRRAGPNEVAGRLLEVLERLHTGQRESGWSIGLDASRNTAVQSMAQPQEIVANAPSLRPGPFLRATNKPFPPVHRDRSTFHGGSFRK